MVTVLGAASDARELYLMPTLLPLVLLATARVDRLPPSAASALGRLGSGTFGLLAIGLWLGWIALLTGAPSALSRVLAERQPGFVARFDEVGFGVALLATAAWSWLARQPPRNAQLGIVPWTAGLTLCLSLVGSLWLPYIDAGKSYRALIQSLAGALHGPSCVASRALGEPQRALLHYFAALDTVREEVVPAPQCDAMLVQGWRSSGAPALAPGWTPLWEGARPGDHNELYRLYVRAAPVAPTGTKATRRAHESGAPWGILKPVHARFAAADDRYGPRVRASGDAAAPRAGSESYADPIFDLDVSRDRRR